MDKEKIKKNFLIRKFENLVEAIYGNELLIEWLETKEGKDSMGSEKAKEEIEKTQKVVKEQELELRFLEKKLG